MRSTNMTYIITHDPKTSARTTSARTSLLAYVRTVDFK